MEYLSRLSDRILTIRVPAKAPKYVVPIIIFVLYFVISHYIMPYRVVKIGELMRLGLLGLLVLNFLHKQEKIPNLGVTPIFLIFLFLSDLHQGNIAVGINPKPLAGYAQYILVSTKIGLIILLQLYMKSWDRLIESLKVLVIMVTVTYSLLGLYQIFSDQKLVDYAKMGAIAGEAEGGRYLAETERLTGLPGGGGVMLLPSLGFLIAPFFLKEKRKLISLLFFLNALALIFTFSRTGYIAFIAMLTIAIFSILRTWKVKRAKKIQSAIIVLLIGGLAVFIFLFIGWPYLLETGEIRRFESPANIIGRLQWWGLALDVVDNYLFFGIGLRSDLSFEFWKYSSVYKTPHNFIIGWIMQMGLIQTVILLFFILRQIFLLFNCLRFTLSPSIYWVGFSLTIAYIGILITSLAGTDSNHCVLLMAAFSNAYLKLTPRVGKSPIAKSFR